jgi:hypothetical protein
MSQDSFQKHARSPFQIFVLLNRRIAGSVPNRATPPTLQRWVRQRRSIVKTYTFGNII